MSKRLFSVFIMWPIFVIGLIILFFPTILIMYPSSIIIYIIKGDDNKDMLDTGLMLILWWTDLFTKMENKIGL